MALYDSHSGSHWLSLPLYDILWPSLAHYFSLISRIQPLIGSQGPCSALIADATMTHFIPLCWDHFHFCKYHCFCPMWFKEQSQFYLLQWPWAPLPFFSDLGHPFIHNFVWIEYLTFLSDPEHPFVFGLVLFLGTWLSMMISTVNGAGTPVLVSWTYRCCWWSRWKWISRW